MLFSLPFPFTVVGIHCPARGQARRVDMKWMTPTNEKSGKRKGWWDEEGIDEGSAFPFPMSWKASPEGISFLFFPLPSLSFTAAVISFSYPYLSPALLIFLSRRWIRDREGRMNGSRAKARAPSSFPIMFLLSVGSFSSSCHLVPKVNCWRWHREEK